MNGEISGKFLGNDTDICYNERLLIIDMTNEVDPCNTRRTRKENSRQHISRNKEFSVFASFEKVQIFSIPRASASLLCKQSHLSLARKIFTRNMERHEKVQITVQDEIFRRVKRTTPLSITTI